MSDSPARVAADVAALYPMDHPVARIARDRLALEVRSQAMTSPYAIPGSPYYNPIIAASIEAEGDALVGSALRDAFTDPEPQDLRVERAPAGQPDAVMQAAVTDREHLAEVARRRSEAEGDQP